MNWRTALRATALGGTMLLGVSLLPSATAQARDRNDRCYERISKQERKLRRDIERHGYNSRQARNDRHELNELRQGCRVQGRNWRRGDGDNDRDDRGRQGRRRGGDRDRDRSRNERDWDDR